LEGVIVVNEHISPGSLKDVRCTHPSNCSIVHDSLLAVLSAENLTLPNATFLGATGTVHIRENRRLRNISFIHVNGGFREEIAHYDSRSLQFVKLPNTYFASGALPRGSTLIVEYAPSLLHSVLVVTSFTTCTIIVSIVFGLYIYFRKEPEIKATSVTVSVCMFLGCYLLLLLLPDLLVNAYPVSQLPCPTWLVCNLLAWLSLLGFPLTLILATLFVKMLRVYLIFCAPHSYQRKLFSNTFLFLYIVLLTSPSVILLLLWSATDELTNT
jgi:hypothetical protein